MVDFFRIFILFEGVENITLNLTFSWECTYGASLDAKVRHQVGIRDDERDIGEKVK